MSSKFVSKLKKDLKKSPGKAAVLAVLLAVAVWFWSPLIMGMFGGPPATKPTAAGNPATTSTTTSPAAASTAPQYTWKQITAAIGRDPKMLSAEPVASPRDPFRAVAPEKPKHKPETKTVELPPVVLDVLPSDAGLVLNSTIVGPTRGVARVNGKTYRSGDSIPGFFGNKTLDYRLMSIGGRSVVLALGDKVYELKMLRPQNGSASTSTVGVSSDSPDFDPTVLE